MEKGFTVVKVAQRLADRKEKEGAPTRTNEKGKKEIFIKNRFGGGCWYEIAKD